MPSWDRLSALDAAFLDLETAQAPLHVGWTIRLDGSPPSLAALRRHLDARLERVPRFRRRVVSPLLGDRHWADDPAFDIANHVHSLRVRPGAGTGARELRELASMLLSRPVDHDRPLWRMYLVGGLPTGWAVVGQAHHALVDGIAAVEVAMLLFDVAGHEPPAAPPARWSPAPAPGSPATAVAYAADRVRGTMRLARSAMGALPSAPRAVPDVGTALRQLATPAPATGLDRSATCERAVAFGEVALDAVREVGARHGATVNDVLLAAATIALGRALRRRGDTPDEVKVLVPVSVRDEDDAGALGNAISFLTVELPVAETNPVTVLRRVHTRMRARKAGGAAAPLHALAQVGDLMPGAARRVVTRAAARSAAFNSVVSNVPGPPVDLTLLGRPVSAIFPAVPFLDGHGLSIGALSYRGRLHLGLYADADVVPDAVDVARDLEAAFDALRLPPTPTDTPWRMRAQRRRAMRRV
ncbi:MAG: wax ester/triacylglycerol synthase family O-acyltransferase [Solirubrobacteraceae bacterium]